MKHAKGLMGVIASATLIVGLGGCASSLIGVHEGTDRVSLADANQVGGCQSKGTNIVSVLAKIGFINRNPEDVEANLYQLALNDAVDAGADTIVKGESSEFGKRAYKMYKCRP
jgi:hypothetical protein